MATKTTAKSKTVFTVYFDIPKIQVSVALPGESFEAVLEEARKITTHELFDGIGHELTDYEKAEINGIYKQ